MVTRRGRGERVCARGACWALLGGPSTSPLDGLGHAVPQEDPPFERWRTPRWFPLVAVPVLGALVLGDVALIYVWLHERGRGRGSLPLLIVIISAVALLLLLRLWKAMAPRASSSRGSVFSGSGRPSNNRWRGP